MDFRILGPVEAFEHGLPLSLGGAKQKALLAVLLLNANEVVTTDRLIDALWDDPPANAVKAVQVYVARLRKALGGMPSSRPPGYLLELSPEQLDLARFRRLREAAGGEPAGAAKTLGEALALWRGPALAEFAREPFARGERLRLEEERLEALEERLEVELVLGRHATLVGELEALVSTHPTRERLRTQLMLALYRCGRQADALAVFRDGRRRLVEELGIEPGRALRELHRQILEQDSRLELVGLTAPIGLEAVPEGVFVGRERELSALVVALDEAMRGHGRLVLLAGEPGIGKTRLGEEVAGRAHAAGARVLAGRCWEAGGAPAYWPWVQAMRAYLRAADPAQTRPRLGAFATELATLLPELRELLPDLPDPPGEPEGARIRLFDATVSFLTSTAQVHPLVLILDDLHAADEPSLLLLRFLARGMSDSRMLVIGSYRTVDPTVGDPLSATLAELSREPVTRRIELVGLDETEVAEYISRTATSPITRPVIADVYAQTDGNPFFVAEVTRLLLNQRASEAHPSGRSRVPQSVSDVIGRRLRRLSDECQQVLSDASVFGREFQIIALARCGDLQDDRVREVIDEAMAERVVGVVPDAPGHVRFAHALIRDTLYEDLSHHHRARLHWRAGTALEAVYGDRLESHLSEVAHHFARAVPAGADKAVEYARRAAATAAKLLAFEEAARLYRLALSLVEADRPPRRGERCELLVELGDVLARAGDLPAAREAFLQAAELAEAIGRGDLLARAALGYGGRFVWTGRDVDGMAPLLQKAADALGEEVSPLRVRVLARLANAISQHRPAETDALTATALKLARQLDDPATLAYALSARLLGTRAPTDLDERWLLTDELIATGDKERAFEGHGYRTIILSARGDVPRIRQELAAMAELAAELGQSSQQWWTASTSAMLALLEGRFGEADQLIARAHGVAERAVGYDAVTFNEIQRFVLCREQGRLPDALPGLEQTVEVGRAAGIEPGRPLLRCALALAYRELGHQQQSMHLCDELTADDYAQLHVNNDWLLSASLLAELVSTTGDRERADGLYRRLAPFNGLNVDTEEVSTGAVSRYLGLLATVGDHFQQAERHFADALDLNHRIGARPWLAHTQEDYARALLKHRDQARRSEAAGLLASAHATYLELGMTTHTKRTHALKQQLGTAP